MLRKVLIWKLSFFVIVFAVWGKADESTLALNKCDSPSECGKVLASAVLENWSRPPSARAGMRVVLDIELSYDRTLDAVSVKESSGNPDFDKSAIFAIKKASPFQQLNGLSDELFAENFQNFTLVFEPEDIRQ